MNIAEKYLLKPLFTLPVRFSEKVINFFYPPMTWYDNVDDSGLQLLKDNFKEIQKEVLNYIDNHILKNLEDLVPNNKDMPSFKGAWKAAPLKAYDRFFEKVLNHCPVLYSVLKQLDNVEIITISKLVPGASIKPHEGAFGGFIRAHLAIKVPEGDTALVVGGEPRKWTEGEFLFFNDRAMHSAYNNTNEDRIVFIMDMERPLPFPLRIMNNAVKSLIKNSPYFKRLIKNADAD